jgi:hypothetical protein
MEEGVWVGLEAAKFPDPLRPREGVEVELISVLNEITDWLGVLKPFKVAAVLSEMSMQAIL